jgi:hypothetical protein
VRLFGNSKKRIATELTDTKEYENGLQIMSYRISYT